MLGEHMTSRSRTCSSTAVCALATTLLALMMLSPATAGALAAASPSVTTPTLKEVPPGSGTHGYPYDAVPATPAIAGAPFINLNAAGYVEREFTMSGGAKTYQQNGWWLPNGAWGASVASARAPFTTRLLVRYPTNPTKFNGTVIIEWLNDTTGGDQDPVWSQLYTELLNEGYAYVGVTAQTAGMSDLKTWDPQRYGALGDSSDAQSYDIFSQAAQVLHTNNATVLGGLTAKHVVGVGDSQSAFRVVTYVNAIQPLTHAFNGFLAVGRAVTAAPIGNGLIAASPFPALIRSDNTTPFIQLNTQGDIVELDAAAARQPDNNYLRTWELPGASHIDGHEAAYEVETIAREQPTVAIPRCVLGTPIQGTGTILDGINQVNNMPLFEVEDAAVAALQKWVTTGVQPPHSPTISTTPLLFGLYHTVNLDQYGNALGGIRLPEIQAPTEFYSPINFSQTSNADLNPIALLTDVTSALTALSTGSINNPTVRSAGLCLLSGYFTPLPSSTITQLYPTHAAYVAKYTAAANAAVAAGFLTPADAAAAITKVQDSTQP
jgi:hypothetical protein